MTKYIFLVYFWSLSMVPGLQFRNLLNDKNIFSIILVLLSSVPGRRCLQVSGDLTSSGVASGIIRQADQGNQQKKNTRRGEYLAMPARPSQPCCKA